VDSAKNVKLPVEEKRKKNQRPECVLRLSNKSQHQSKRYRIRATGREDHVTECCKRGSLWSDGGVDQDKGAKEGFLVFCLV